MPNSINTVAMDMCSYKFWGSKRIIYFEDEYEYIEYAVIKRIIVTHI